MNKKIFTLFAGILLLGLFVTPGYAQFAKRQDLRVGNTVSKLKEGPNPGYYYLAVDSVVGGQTLRAIDTRQPTTTESTAK